MVEKQKIVWSPTPKQWEAFQILQDRITTELFYGGAAGGGKTYLGCVWVCFTCLKYSGARMLVCRNKLKDIKTSTFLTIMDILRAWGFKKDRDFFYNSTENIIRFYNDSTIYFRELFFYPSDPEFDSLGSTEYTGVFIDEGAQVTSKAKNIVMSRIRYKLDEFGIIPKLLIASNPGKNFLYYEYYKPHKEGTLKPYRKFLPSLVYDNPYISKYYIENLKKLDKISKERLLHGNFEYDDDPAKLFEYDNLLNMFTNLYVKKDGELKYISVDVARYGEDKTTIILWDGFYITKMWMYGKDDYVGPPTEFVKAKLINIMTEYAVPRSQVIIDEDGIGGGLVDVLKGVKGFVANSRPFSREQSVRALPMVRRNIPLEHNYGNLKAQCFFSAAEQVNRNEVGIYSGIANEFKDKLIEDLEQIKKHNPDKDGKLMVTPKDIIKQNIGRSPDYGDAFMMRFYFEVVVNPPLCFGTLDVGN